MAVIYPAIEPYDHGMLAVGGGHQIYWECCGNPQGKPAVVLHGGPGGGGWTNARRNFDPQCYRIVLFDQRNCGRSTPHAGDPNTDLSTNTTEHLLLDIERLRAHLGIDRWLLFGASWGSTLALAYAERYPQRVSEIILVGVTMTRRSEIDWLYHGVAPLFPAQWARFQAGAPGGEQSDLVAAYYKLLQHPDPAVRTKAAEEWCTWEDSLLSVDPEFVPERMPPAQEMAFARIVTHYFHHNGWLAADQLLRNADQLAGIPGILIQGRLDLGAPLTTAWELAQAWSDAELVLVQGAGHTSRDPGMPEAIIAATDRFAAAWPGLDVDFEPRPLGEVDTLAAALATLSSPIDSFNEWFVRTAQFYVIVNRATGQVFGHVAIHESMGLTHFYLQPTMRRYGQPLYRALRHRFQVAQAMVPTCDEFFLSHALDEYTELYKQAYFFVAGAPNGLWDDMAGLQFQPATLAEQAETVAINDDFLDRLDQRIAAGEIHIGRLQGKIVAIGIVERGQLLPTCASIGMMVTPAARQRGIGTRMIRYLRHLCDEQGIRPVAGCGYANTLSKRTLEAAGMVTTTRLLRISYRSDS